MRHVAKKVVADNKIVTQEKLSQKNPLIKPLTARPFFYSLAQPIRGLVSKTLSVSNSLYSFAHEPAVNIRLCRYQKFCLKKKQHKTSKISASFQSFCKVL